MVDIRELTVADINHPDHKADTKELLMGFGAVLTALSAAAALVLFHPGKDQG